MSADETSQVDWEASTNAARVCVRPRIDEELDNLKHIHNGIDSILVPSVTLSQYPLISTITFDQSKVATQLSVTIPPDYTPSLNVVYFPQLGEHVAHVHWSIA